MAAADQGGLVNETDSRAPSIHHKVFSNSHAPFWLLIYPRALTLSARGGPAC